MMKLLISMLLLGGASNVFGANHPEVRTQPVPEMSIANSTSIPAYTMFALSGGVDRPLMASSFHSALNEGPAKPIDTCRSIERGGLYLLQKDVTCTNSGFAINASNVRLDLGGHTITYGSRDNIVPAISICDRWYKPLIAVACGDSAHHNVQIYNGSIVQAKGTHPFTHAIWIGQANGLDGGYIHDLTISIQEKGTQAIHGDYPGDGWKIQNNTINDDVTNIEHDGQGALSARSQFQGYAIHMDNGANAKGNGDIISSNKLNHTPQGGIYDSSQNTKIFKNTLHLNSLYSNDYGVVVRADGQMVYENVVDGRGRGLDAESSRFTLSGNTIHVHEEANNSEYHGCELDGSYGIRLKNYAGDAPPSAGWTIENNNVLVDAIDCDARGLQFTDLGRQVQGVVTNNTVQTTGAKHRDYALGFTGVNQSQIGFVKNTFKARTCVLIGNDGSTDGANVIVQAGQTWNCSEHIVHATDLTRDAPAPYPQALTLVDPVSNSSVECGEYSTGTIKLGELTRKCSK